MMPVRESGTLIPQRVQGLLSKQVPRLPAKYTRNWLWRWLTPVIVVATLLTAVPAGADHRPMPHKWYENTDPHDLIGYYDTMKSRTLDFDVWEVWVCDPVGPSDYSSLNRFVGYTPRMVVDWIEKRSQIEQYFAWLSDGEYKPRFRIGGVVSPDMSDHSFGEYMVYHNRREACSDKIMSDSESKHAGLLMVDTNQTGSSIGSGWVGHMFCLNVDPCDPYHSSGRYAYVAGNAWADTYIHEIGHAINWPHSFFISDSDEENPNEYTNIMDVMSGSVGWVGTIAINRYAAGWIDPDDVYVWELGDEDKTVWLDPVGVSGNYQMLVIRDSHGSYYYTFGARVRDRFDIHIPKEGVEGYVVDESTNAGCGWDGWDWCPGYGRAVNALGEPFSTDHVLDVEETTFVLLWDGDDWVEVDVAVTDRDGGSFKVRIRA